MAKIHMTPPNKRSRSKIEVAKANATTVCLLGNEEFFLAGISKRTGCTMNGRGLK